MFITLSYSGGKIQTFNVKKLNLYFQALDDRDIALLKSYGQTQYTKALRVKKYFNRCKIQTNSKIQYSRLFCSKERKQKVRCNFISRFVGKIRCEQFIRFLARFGAMRERAKLKFHLDV